MEDEIIHILSNDGAVTEVVVVENKESFGLMEKLRRHFPAEMIKSIDEGGLSTLERSEGLGVLIWMKPMALHESPERLKGEVRDTMEAMKGTCDSILLFYGLCGNAFRKLGEVADDVQIPVCILKDDRGEVVDDCIGAVVGGTEEYLALLKKYPGVMYLTPMWASNWREMIVKTGVAPTADDLEMLRMIFEMVGYKKVLKINTGLGDQDQFEKEVRRFAELFNFEEEEMNNCTLEVIERSWKNAKDSLI